MLNLFKSKTNISREDILNSGYKMALDFGKNWLQTINERLGKKYPHLTTENLEEFNQICEQLRTDSSNYIYERLTKLTEDQKEISEKEFKLDVTNWIKERVSWISKSNVRRTFSQGMYYAWKEGIAECVK